MRNLSPDALTKLATRTGTEPVTIIEVEWIDGAVSIYADRSVGSIPGRILDVSNLDSIISVSDNNSSQELEITLDDTDGSIKAIFDTNDIHKRTVRVYQWFEGLDLGDRFLLFRGQVSSPCRWSERDRTIRFSIVSQLEDKEIGFSAEEGEFPWVPDDLVGRAWPMIFGTVQDVPALQFNHAVTGTTLCGVGILSGRDYHLAMPVGEDDQSMAVSASAMLAQIGHLNSVYDAYHRAWFDSGYEDYRTKAEECQDQANSIRAQLNQMYTQQQRQELCVRQQREEAVEEQGLGCNPVRILGGEDFPQNTGLHLKINGGLFIGHFEGDLFYISDRLHEDNEAKAEEVYEQAQIPLQCLESAPYAEWDYQTNVPPGYGGAFLQDGPRFKYVRDVIRTHGYSIGTRPITPRPSVDRVAQHFWAEPGSRVTIASDEQITYVVSIIPGTVLAVKAYKTFNNETKLVNVPSDLWRVEVKDYGPITAVQVVLNKPLSTIEGQGWADDLYVTFQSEVGPHTCDILTYIIDNYTDLSYDSVSFDDVRPKLDPFPMNFPILDRKNTLDVLQEIAFQARCALWIDNGVFRIKYLPEEPTADSTITASDLDSEMGVEISLTPTEDLVTKMVVNWRLSWAEDKPNKLILRHNVNKYGTQSQEYDFYCFNQPDIILKAATFWLIRKSNTWKRVRFKTFLSKLNLETFDTALLDFGHVANCPIKAVIEEATYDSNDHTVDFTCWTPVKGGKMEPYVFAWPSQVDPSIEFPTEEEIAEGNAGGGGIGQNAEGELPIGFTDLRDWGSGVVWVGGPNVVFRGHSDWGDTSPSDIGFIAQNVILPNVFAELDVRPRPNLNLSLNYAPAVKPPPLQEMPSGTFVIDIRETRLVDSQEDHGESARLDSFFKRINSDGDLVVDVSNAKFGDEDHEDGKPYDFRFDEEGEQWGAGTAFLKP